MKKRATQFPVKFSVFIYMLAIAGSALLVNACNKSKEAAKSTAENEALRKASGRPLLQHEPITSVVTIANLRTAADGNSIRAMFAQNQQILNVTDASVIATLKSAFNNHQAVQITFDPWQAIVSQASIASSQDQSFFNARKPDNTAGITMRIDPSVTDESINHTAAMGVVNVTTSGLTNVIPDFATAQLMFDYIAHQCCQLPGPYALDHCITFQYCEDGCYARAHKMCWILNNRYHYGTQKVFSFALGSDELCVKAEKWGGCCINWWYHVAPLVTIKTTTGPKAYVFDPAMFDQPVLLSTWLHAQTNPDCASGFPHVTMINVQPTTSYEPSDYTGYHFDPDPTFYYTNSTLTSYRYLVSCP